MGKVLTREELARLPDHVWELESVSTDGLRHTYVYYDLANDKAYRKTTNLVEEDLLKVIHEERADNEGRRWGSGKIAARVPMNVYMQEFASRRREGDNDFAKWWLNHENNQVYRTKRGRV
jgi:hypothetical protein